MSFSFIKNNFPLMMVKTNYETSFQNKTAKTYFHINLYSSRWYFMRANILFFDSKHKIVRHEFHLSKKMHYCVFFHTWQNKHVCAYSRIKFYQHNDEVLKELSHFLRKECTLTCATKIYLFWNVSHQNETINCEKWSKYQNISAFSFGWPISIFDLTK